MTRAITLRPIAVVENERRSIEDDHWGGVVSAIRLLSPLGPQALDGIEEFSHVEVLFFFDRVPAAEVETGARRPRGNPDWPAVGILAQRAKGRPNRLGVTIARVVRREGATLFVQGLDALDGTPVLDIKPVMREFLPREPVRQPEWATDLMNAYWED